MSSPSLPPGYSAPATVITNSDHSGWITITSGLVLCHVLLFLGIRVYIRVSVSPPFRWDDTVLCLATALCIIQFAVVFLQSSKGFGKSIDLIGPEDLVEVQKLGYVSDILYLLDLLLSKCSVGLLLILLTPNKTYVRLFQALLGFTALSALVSVFLVALRCDLSQPWIQYNAQCSSLFARWTFITAVNIFVEACLFIGSVSLIINLMMAMQKKTTVVMVFGSRLLLIAITILRLHYLKSSLLSSNPTLEGVSVVLLTQLELGWSLISATIPCLNPFMRAVSTKLGSMDAETIMNGSYLVDTNKAGGGDATGAGSGGSYGLRSFVSRKSRILRSHRSTKSLKSSAPSIDQRASLPPMFPVLASSNTDPDSGTQSQPPGAGDQQRIYQGDRFSNIAQVFSEGRGDAQSIGHDSNDSTSRMIIKKDVQWTVDCDKHTVSTTHTAVTAEEGGEQSVREEMDG